MSAIWRLHRSHSLAAQFVTLLQSQCTALFGQSICSSKSIVLRIVFVDCTNVCFNCSQLFGEDDPDQDVSPDAEDPEAKKDGDGTHSTTETGNVVRVSTRQWVQDVKYDAAKLFNKFFYDDIKYLLTMGKNIHHNLGNKLTGVNFQRIYGRQEELQFP